MNYKFIDIGCGHQSVSSDIFGTDVVGMYVEPIKQYLDVLPSGKHIVKENCAISNRNGIVKFNAVIVEDPEYFSNSEMTKIVKDNHLLHEHLKKYSGSGQSSIDVKLNSATEISVESMTLETLFKKHNVTSIDYLKIDVEGHDEVILRQLLVLLHDQKISINKQICFEYNHLSDRNKLDRLSKVICKQFNFTGQYVESLPWNKDMILTKG